MCARDKRVRLAGSSGANSRLSSAGEGEGVGGVHALGGGEASGRKRRAGGGGAVDAGGDCEGALGKEEEGEEEEDDLFTDAVKRTKILGEYKRRPQRVLLSRAAS